MNSIPSFLKMPKLVLLGICLFTVLTAKGQRLSYEYEYDNAGNRIRSTVIQLNSRDLSNENNIEASVEFTDVIPDGTVIKLFPNPTQSSVKIELTEDRRIGNYVLTDLTGRIITSEECNNHILIIDLSSNVDGVYLLTIQIDKTNYTCKIIKQ